MAITTEKIWAKEFCEFFEIHRKTLTRWIDSGRIPGTKVAFPFSRSGRRVYFTQEQFNAIIEAQGRVRRPRPPKKAA